MSIEADSQARAELYERHNLSSAGRKFIAYILPVFERSVDFGEELETDTQDEVLAEIALWKAFDEEPILRPFGLLTMILLFYDFLHSLPFEVYGILIIGLATLSGLVSGLGGSHLLAAEYAGKTDADGIPASLLARATSIASSTVTLVFVTVGIGIQIFATSEVVGTELLDQNVMAGGPLPPIGTFLLTLFGLYALNLIRE